MTFVSTATIERRRSLAAGPDGRFDVVNRQRGMLLQSDRPDRMGRESSPRLVGYCGIKDLHDGVLEFLVAPLGAQPQAAYELIGQLDRSSHATMLSRNHGVVKTKQLGLPFAMLAKEATRVCRKCGRCR